MNNTGGTGTGTGNQAGLIMPNSNNDLLVFMDSAIQELYSDLRNVGDPELILDNYIVFGIPPLTQVNPAVQVSLGYQGYFDGFQWHPEWKLPISVSKMLAMWERQGGGAATTSTSTSLGPPLTQSHSNRIDESQPVRISNSSNLGPFPVSRLGTCTEGDTFDTFATFGITGMTIDFYNSSFVLIQSVPLDDASSFTAPAGATSFIMGAPNPVVGTEYSCTYHLNGGTQAFDWAPDPTGWDTNWSGQNANQSPFGGITPGSVFTLTPFETTDPTFIYSINFYNASKGLISSSVWNQDPFTFTAPAGAAFWSVIITNPPIPDLTTIGTVFTIQYATSTTIASIAGESQDNFVPMRPAPFGLPGIQQGQSMSIWEMRNGQIWMPGCLTYRDLRIRARITYPVPFGPNINFATTYVPILDSRNAIVAKMLILYAKRFAPEQYPMAISEEDRLMQKLKLEVVRQLQAQENQRSEFGAEAVQDFAISYNWL